MAKRKRPRDKWSFVKRFKNLLTFSWIEHVVIFNRGPFDGCINYVDEPLTDVYREEILSGRWVVYRLIKIDTTAYRAEFMHYESSGPNKPNKKPEPVKVPA